METLPFLKRIDLIRYVKPGEKVLALDSFPGVEVGTLGSVRETVVIRGESYVVVEWDLDHRRVNLRDGIKTSFREPELRYLAFQGSEYVLG